MTQFLNLRAPGLAPQIVGAIELRRGRAEPSTLAVLQAYVPNEGTAWTHTLEELRRFFERALTRHRDIAPPAIPSQNLLQMTRAELPPAVREVIGTYLEQAAQLGRRTAELHQALASNVGNPAFAPEPYSTLDRRSKYQSMRNVVGKTLRQLRASVGGISARVRTTANVVTDSEGAIMGVFEPLLTQRLSGMRIRVHGDYHLEQVLYTGKDFVIIDFSGLSTETLVERRRKHSAIRDVAGMIRSFHFAAHLTLLDGTVVREEDRAVANPWADAWYRWVSAVFLRAYLDATRGAAFLPGPDDLPLMLTTHLLEKAFNELRDELKHPAGETVLIPLLAIADLAGR
jgi:maltose alpha-D-glucosyltransferase/alpha-amylase